MIICSGSIPFLMYGSLFFFPFTLLSFLYWFIKNRRLNRSIVFTIYISLIIFLSTLYNGISNLKFLFPIGTAFNMYFLISSCSLQSFKEKYLNIICILSVVSLFVFWGSQMELISPSFVFSPGSIDIDVFFFHNIGWQGYLYRRCSGIFTESGVYQIFLNYCLLLNLDDVARKKTSPKTNLKLVIVIVTLLCCASTTGYIVLMLLIVYYILTFKSKHKYLLLFPSIIVGTLVISFLYNSEVVAYKLLSGESVSYEMRSSDNITYLKMIADYPFLGSGYVTDIFFQRMAYYHINTLSNGILVALARVGISWIFFYLFFSYKSITKMGYTMPLFMVLISLIVQTNEGFSFMPIIYIFLYKYKDYEIYEDEKQVKRI